MKMVIYSSVVIMKPVELRVIRDVRQAVILMTGLLTISLLILVCSTHLACHIAVVIMQTHQLISLHKIYE
jgi:hypothetical protein